jgi:hypothetical protein
VAVNVSWQEIHVSVSLRIGNRWIGGEVGTICSCHRTTDLRAVLEPVAEWAERQDAAVLAISHPPKAMHAVTGSLAYVPATLEPLHSNG